MNVDPNTGEVFDDDEKRRLLELLQASERQVSIVRSQLHRERSIRNREEENDPLYVYAQRIWEYWRMTLHPKAREFGKKDREKVMERLRAGDDPDQITREIFEAINGAERLPFVTDSGRSATGSPKDRHDSLELICRTEDNVRRFRSYAKTEREQPPPLLPPELQSRDLAYLMERCGCGHMRMEHSRSDPAREGAQPCLLACSCQDFDDLDIRAENWLRQHGARKLADALEQDRREAA